MLFFSQFYSSPVKPSPVEEEHILLALILVDPDLVQSLSPGCENVTAAIKGSFGDLMIDQTHSWFATEPPPLSSSAEGVLSAARDWSISLGDGQVDTEHLLLALVDRQPAGANAQHIHSRVAEILTGLGFNTGDVLARLRTGTLKRTRNSNRPRLGSPSHGG